MGTLTGNTPSLAEHCQHKLPSSCRLTATAKCCACQDMRPHKPAYSTYVDGLGMVERGTRWQRYCWFCREFWSNRVRIAGIDPRMTKVPEEPPQDVFLTRWFEYHQGYREVAGDQLDSSVREVVVPEVPWSEVEPGHLPMLDQSDMPARPMPVQAAANVPHVSLDETLDDLMNTPGSEDDEPQVTQLSRQEPTSHSTRYGSPSGTEDRPHAIRAPRRHHQGTSNPNAMIEAARTWTIAAETRRRGIATQLTAAEARRRDIAAHLADAEEEVARCRRAQAQIMQAQSTSRNLERVFGSREEIQSQGESYISPLTSMFARADERYNTAEEVRAAERASHSNERRSSEDERLLAFVNEHLAIINQYAVVHAQSDREHDQPHSLDDERIQRPPPRKAEEMRITLTCRICLQQVADTAVLPCGHLVMCNYCAVIAVPTKEADKTQPRRRAAACPLCRERVKRVARIYTS